MSIAFFGFGLIGGSIARALRAADGAQPELVAWSPTGHGPRLALADDVLDSVAASPAEALDGAEIVVLAAPRISDRSSVLRMVGLNLVSMAVSIRCGQIFNSSFLDVSPLPHF